jgi:hypothetical protein
MGWASCRVWLHIPATEAVCSSCCCSCWRPAGAWHTHLLQLTAGSCRSLFRICLCGCAPPGILQGVQSISAAGCQCMQPVLGTGLRTVVPTHGDQRERSRTEGRSVRSSMLCCVVRSVCVDVVSCTVAFMASS